MTKNIYLLPTDKPSRLFWNFNKLSIGTFRNVRIGELVSNRNIYITSDEEIKEGDWVLDLCEDLGLKNQPFKVDKATLKFANQECKKIILTTDQSLDGVQEMSDEFLEWFVKNSSCEEVEVVNVPDFIYETNHSCYKIIIPKEELTKDEIDKFFVDMVCNPEETKQETLEEGWNPNEQIMDFKKETLEEFIQKSYPKTDSHYDFTTTSKIRNGIRLGAKWKQERSYSEEEISPLIEILKKCKDYFLLKTDESSDRKADAIIDVLEQFKKK